MNLSLHACVKPFAIYRLLIGVNRGDNDGYVMNNECVLSSSYRSKFRLSTIDCKIVEIILEGRELSDTWKERTKRRRRYGLRRVSFASRSNGSIIEARILLLYHRRNLSTAPTKSILYLIDFEDVLDMEMITIERLTKKAYRIISFQTLTLFDVMIFL